MKNIPQQIKSLVIILLITISFTGASAQEQGINFVLSSNTVDISGTIVSINSTFTKSSYTLTWIQENNDVSDITTFTIDSITNNWDQTTSSGSLYYELNWEEIVSELLQTQESTSILAKLTMHISENKQMNTSLL